MANIMAFTAEPESGSGTGQPSHTSTPDPAPTLAPAPAPTPAPVPGPVPGQFSPAELGHGSLRSPEGELLCGCLVCQVDGAPGPRRPWPFLSEDDPRPLGSFVGPLPLFLRNRRKRARSTTGSGSASGRAPPSKGWLGSFIMLQARVRGARARARFVVLAESWRRLDLLIHNSGQYGESRSGKAASCSRESAAIVYGAGAQRTTCDKYDTSVGCSAAKGPAFLQKTIN